MSHNEVELATGYFITTMQADSTITGNAPGGIWDTFADIGISTPYVQVTFQSGSDTNTANAVRLFSRLLFQIKAIGLASSMSTLVTLANEIDTLFGSLHSVALSSGGILECWRTQPLKYSELVNGIHYAHVGGLFQIDLQGA